MSESTCLRARMVEAQGLVQQQILPTAQSVIAEHAFANESLARQRLAADLLTPVDLEHGPLLQAWCSVAENADCLYVKSHHIALDGVGLGLFLKRWAALYSGQATTQRHWEHFTRCWRPNRPTRHRLPSPRTVTTGTSRSTAV
jgi:nonribosomal peptide synthetase DhbF